MAKLTKESFIESLKEMNIKEVMELVEAMKEEFGIDPSAVAVAAGPAADAGEAVKSEVTVKITGDGGKKVAIIKVVKDILGIGLMEAKALVEALPATVKADIKPEEAEEIKAKLVEAGAEVTVE